VSQCSEMRDALKRGESFTRMDALRRFGTAKAPARISELRWSTCRTASASIHARRECYYEGKP